MGKWECRYVGQLRPLGAWTFRANRTFELSSHGDAPDLDCEFDGKFSLSGKVLRLQTQGESYFDGSPLDRVPHEGVFRVCWKDKDHVTLKGSHSSILLVRTTKGRSPKTRFVEDRVNPLIADGAWAALLKLSAPKAEIVVCEQTYPQPNGETPHYEVKRWPLADTAHPDKYLADDLRRLSSWVRRSSYSDGAYAETPSSFRELPFASPGWVGKIASNAYWKVALDRNMRVNTIMLGTH